MITKCNNNTYIDHHHAVVDWKYINKWKLQFSVVLIMTQT